MNKTKIEWTDYTWNPIKGVCPVGCWYCYARKIYKRFKLDPVIRIDSEYPNMIFMPLYDRQREIIHRKVFVCSTIELFHPSVKKEWRDWIFDVIEYNKNLTFQILTKLPQNIDRPMPDNVWLGVSIADPLPEHERAYDLLDHSAKIEFISLEPLIGEYFYSVIPIELFDWVIVGRMTGHGHKYDPKKESIKRIVSDCRRAKTPVFLKDNLKEIWGESLIQEFPE